MRALRAAIVVVSLASAGWSAEWTPAAWKETDTLDLETDVPGEGKYWFPVWLVVLDDQVYVRLGSKASDRVKGSQSHPILGVRVAGNEFPKVRGVEAPEMVDKVAAAMADKYSTDIFVRYMSHPLTLRLVPE